MEPVVVGESFGRASSNKIVIITFGGVFDAVSILVVASMGTGAFYLVWGQPRVGCGRWATGGMKAVCGMLGLTAATNKQ